MIIDLIHIGLICLYFAILFVVLSRMQDEEEYYDDEEER